MPGPVATSARRRRTYALVGGAAAVVVGSALAYRAASRSQAAARGAALLGRLRDAVTAYTDAASAGGALCRLVVQDLQQYLASDDDKQLPLPASLRQLARLLQSPEAADTTATAVAAIVRGVTEDVPSTTTRDASSEGTERPRPLPALDRVLSALLSDRGQSLVTVAVGMAARNAATSYVTEAARQAAAAGAPPARPPLDALLAFLSTPAGQQLAVVCCSAAVSQGVRAYCDQTLDINFYEDLFSSMAKPAHLRAVQACVSAFARDAVGAMLDGGGAEDAPQRPRHEIEELGSERQPGSPAGSSAGELGSWGGERRAGVEVDAREAHAGAHPPPCSRAASCADSVGVCTPPAAGEALQRARLGAVAQPRPAPAPRAAGSTQAVWVSAVGREVLQMARDPHGRAVMVSLAGTTAREAAAGAASALADRLSGAPLLALALLGLVLAWAARLVLHAAAALLLPR